MGWHPVCVLRHPCPDNRQPTTPETIIWRMKRKQGGEEKIRRNSILKIVKFHKKSLKTEDSEFWGCVFIHPQAKIYWEKEKGWCSTKATSSPMATFGKGDWQPTGSHHLQKPWAVRMYWPLCMHMNTGSVHMASTWPVSRPLCYPVNTGSVHWASTWPVSHCEE